MGAVRGFVGSWLLGGFVGSWMGSWIRGFVSLWLGSWVRGLVCALSGSWSELPESVSEGFSLCALIYRGKVAPSLRVRSGGRRNLRSNYGIDFKGFYVDFDGFWAGRV